METQRLPGQHEDQDTAPSCSDIHQFGISNFSQNSRYSPNLFRQPEQYFGGDSIHLHDQNYLLSSNALLTIDQMDYSGSELSNGPYRHSDSYCYPPASGHAGQLQSYSRGLIDQSCPRTYPRLPYQQQVGAKFEVNESLFTYDFGQICPDDSAKQDRELPHGNDPRTHLSTSGGHTVLSKKTPLAAVSQTIASRYDEHDENDDKDDDPAGETPANGEEQISDEPYAKLIYRALLGSPSHSMVLQEIYQWFIDNTDKGSATSSGWRNSIRHNLSMNAAFRKCERVCAEDDGKKNSVWVLEPFAIENGVTPTTRYRKTGKKSLKLEHPTPSRASAGRKGGISAGKVKSQKIKSETDSPESARGSIRESRRKRSQARQRPTPPPMDQRQISPSTPLIMSVTSSPYYFKPPLYDDAFGETGCKFGLEDITGVYYGDSPTYDGYSDNSPYMWPGY